MRFCVKQKWYKLQTIAAPVGFFIYDILLHLLLSGMMKCGDPLQTMEIELTGRISGAVIVFTELVYLMRLLPVLYACNNSVQRYFRCRNYISVRCRNRWSEFLFLQNMILKSFLVAAIPRLLADAVWGQNGNQYILLLWMVLEIFTLCILVQVLVLLNLAAVKSQVSFFVITILLMMGPWSYNTILGVFLLPISAGTSLYTLGAKLVIWLCLLGLTDRMVEKHGYLFGR